MVSGKGLGLTIVKKSVELMGGKIQVNSKEDAGTTFKLFLPLNQEGLDGNSACEDGFGSV